MKTYSTKQIFQIALPILVSALMEQLVGMTDAAFLGRVGEVELGASALGGILYIALFMLAMGLLPVRKYSWGAATARATTRR